MAAYRDEVTKNYLFHSDFPKNLLDENLIGNGNKDGEIFVDAASYMQTGAGH